MVRWRHLVFFIFAGLIVPAASVSAYFPYASLPPYFYYPPGGYTFSGTNVVQQPNPYQTITWYSTTYPQFNKGYDYSDNYYKLVYGAYALSGALHQESYLTTPYMGYSYYYDRQWYVGTNPQYAGSQNYDNLYITCSYTVPPPYQSQSGYYSASTKYSGSWVSKYGLDCNNSQYSVSAASAAAYSYDQPPAADFSYAPASPTNLDTVQFTDASSDPDGAITAWSWNFGDNSASTLRNPTHRYANGGAFTVTLTVTDDYGKQGSTAKSIAVTALLPIVTNLTQAYSSSQTYCPTNLWTWDFQWQYQSPANSPQQYYTLQMSKDSFATFAYNQTTASNSPAALVTLAPSALTFNTTYATRVRAMDSTANWPLTDWLYRRKITFNNNFIGNGTLTNFPALIKLTDGTNFTAANTQAAGQDIRFTDASGNLLAYEIEGTWTKAALGVNYIWVKVPSIAAGSTLDYVYLYYGNPQAPDAQNKNAVWDTNFKMVQHLPNGTTLSANDSTSNANNGTLSATPPTADVGKIDGGANFAAASSEAIDVGNITALNGLSALTVSFWLKPTSLIANQAMITKWDYPTQGAFVIQAGNAVGQGNPGDFLIFIANALTDAGGNLGYSIDGPMSAGVLIYVAAVYDGTQVGNTGRLKLYVNGAQDTLTYLGTIPATLTSASSTVKMARFGGTVTRYLNGVLDEIRISNVARPASYIAAAYQTESNPTGFAAAGSEEKATGISAWSNTLTFTTPKNLYPKAGFAWSPKQPMPNQTVQFTDQSVFSDTGASRQWDWDFGTNGNPAPASSIQQNPTAVFQAKTSSASVTLIATDSNNYSCAVDKSISTTLPLPKYREVNPATGQ